MNPAIIGGLVFLLIVIGIGIVVAVIMSKRKNVQETATKKALPTPAPASTPAPTPSVGKAKPKKAAKAKPKKAAKAKPVVPMVIPKKGKNCRGKWSKWSACSDDCKKTKTWTTTTEPTGDGKVCPSPNTKSVDCVRGRCAVEWEQTAARVVRPPPKVKTAEQLAAIAASQARIQAAIDAHDADEILRAGRSAKARCRIDKYVEDEWIQGFGEYSAWDCEAGAAGSGGFGTGGGYRHIEISR